MGEDKQELVAKAGRVEPLPRLIDVARREFIRTGFDAASIDGIARAAGMSKETIYRYFEGKEALFRAAIEELGECYSAQAQAIDAMDMPAEEALTQHALAICEASADGGFLSGVWLAVSTARDMPDFVCDLQDRYTARLEPLRRTLERAVASPGMPPSLSQTLSLDDAADFGSLAVQGQRHLMGEPEGDPASQERDARRTARFFLHGCRSDHGFGLSSLQGLLTFIPPSRPEERPDHLANLITVATDHFITRGFQGANLDEIGEEARVGRGTLYRHFRNKAGLFDAAMLGLARQVGETARWSAPSGGSPLQMLQSYLMTAAMALTSLPAIRLRRTVIAESRRSPQLAQQVHRILMEPWALPLESWLAEAASHDILSIDAPNWYAEQLLVYATRGNRPTITGHPMTATDCDVRAASAVALLLGGILEVLRKRA